MTHRNVEKAKALRIEFYLNIFNFESYGNHGTKMGIFLDLKIAGNSSPIIIRIYGWSVVNLVTSGQNNEIYSFFNQDDSGRREFLWKTLAYKGNSVVFKTKNARCTRKAVTRHTQRLYGKRTYNTAAFSIYE